MTKAGLGQRHRSCPAPDGPGAFDHLDRSARLSQGHCGREPVRSGTHHYGIEFSAYQYSFGSILAVAKLRSRYVGGDLTLYIPGDPIPGYLAVPDGTGPFPGVVVLHQAFGLDDDIRRQTDRVASLGYLAVAPDLVAAGGWRCLARLFLDVARGNGPGVEQAESVVTWLKNRSECSGQVGALGFCLGGGFAYLLGLRGAVAVTAPNYGMAPGSMLGSCPVVASYGGRDKIFARQGPRVARQLDRAGIDHDVEVYPQAGHGFMNQVEGHQLLSALNRPLMALGYQREASEDTWRRIESFFSRYL